MKRLAAAVLAATVLAMAAPAAAVDPYEINAILPLTVDPAPVATARIFVGRMELITPAVQSDVAHAVAANDTVAIERRARFFGAVADRVLATTTDVRLIQHYQELSDGSAGSAATPASGC